MARIWDRTADGRTDRRSDAKDAPGISNENSVNFDGTNDYMSTGGADTNLADKTYTFWAKSSATAVSEKNTIFSHGGSHKGGFHFNWSSSRPLLYLGTSYYRFWQDVASGAQDDGAWHFWTVVVDVSDVTGSLLYVDAVLQTADTDATTVANVQAYEGIQLGRAAVGDNHFTGNIDEFCVFDGHLTAAEILTLWNNGIPTSPIGVAPGQLEHWWRMGDDGGSGTFIPDEASPGLGADVITNGDFDSWTGIQIDSWTHHDANHGGGGGEISQVGSGEGNGGSGTGSVNFYSTGAVSMLLTGAGGDLTVGDTYKMEIGASRFVSGTLHVNLATGGVDFVAGDVVGGVITHYFRATGYTFFRLNGSGACDYTFDYCRCKKVNGNPGILESGAAIQTDAP